MSPQGPPVHASPPPLLFFSLPFPDHGDAPVSHDGVVVRTRAAQMQQRVLQTIYVQKGLGSGGKKMKEKKKEKREKKKKKNEE